MLPNAHLLAKAFHRSTLAASTLTRRLSGSPPRAHKEAKAKGIGSTGKDHATRGATHNPEVDATKAGMAARERAQLLDDATSERDTHRAKEKGERDYPEAPRPVLGLNDERASKEALNSREGYAGKKKE